MNRDYRPREIEALVRGLLEVSPAVKIEGARQVGKSTLAERISEDLGGRYLTLDDMDTLRAFQDKPLDMIEQSSDRLLVLDEVQLVPGLIRQVKHHIDKHRRPGMFLLTGSGDRFRSSEDSRPLTGRGAQLFMRPFSQPEIEGKVGAGPVVANDLFGKSIDLSGSSNFVDRLFGGQQPPDLSCEGLRERVMRGGYPIPVFHPEQKARFLSTYINDELTNNLIRMSNSEHLTVMPQLLRKLSRKQGKIINVSELAEEINRTSKVTKVLVDLLTKTYLLEPLPSYPIAIRKKATMRKTKIYLNDSGLVATMRNLDGQEVRGGDWGTLLEVFVLSELRKSIACSGIFNFGRIYYYHEHNGIEVDFVIDDGTDDETVAIEVKASDSLSLKDWRNLAKFKEISGGKCRRCVLLYGGSKFRELAKGIEAWPMSCLWSWD